MNNPALFVKRIVALILDNIVLAIIGFVIGLIVGDQAGLIGWLIAFVIGVGYQWFFLTRNNGQTIGKQLLGIRVVSAGGGPVSDVQAVLRYIGYYVNTILCAIGWIYALFDAEQRGFHDMIASTRVIEA